MAKTPMRCPFNEKICEECQIYRGRHYYLSACEHYRGYIKSRDSGAGDAQLKRIDLETIKRLFEPWTARGEKSMTSELKIKLKIIDMENGKERYCDFEETKDWRWGDPNIMRVINGTHVTSLKKLEEIMQYQETKGTAELIIYEAPRFMLLGGG